jgi:[protein-PII] uridylyltransferase
VFYVTDLLGAKITSPTRQAAIRRALMQLFTPAGLERPREAAAATAAAG